MHPFPSPDECTVASALLLLSNTTPLSPPSNLGVDGKKYVKERSDGKGSCEEESWSSVTSGSKLCVSSLTSDVSLFKEIRAHKLRIVAIVSRCYEMKPKVARRKRSKVTWSSGHQRTDVVAPPEKAAEASTESGSCLSSTSSSASSARNHHMKREGLVMKPARVDEEEPKKIRSSSGSLYLCSLAEAILKLLSSGVFSEMRIRQVLGDSPSTSKALRMLLRQDEVKRSGRGGRQDPYIYKDRSFAPLVPDITTVDTSLELLMVSVLIFLLTSCFLLSTNASNLISNCEAGIWWPFVCLNGQL